MILNLQILRAVAAMGVVVYHCIVTAGKYGFHTALAGRYQEWGAAGVDLFFVISGFVMVLVQQRKPRGALAFFGNRLARIVPIYWALTLLMMLLIVLLPAAFDTAMPAAERPLVALLRSLVFVSGRWGDYPVLYLGWTLEYEMFFYLLFAIGILTGGLARGAALAAVLIAASVAMGVYQPIALEFLLGMAIGFLWLAGRLPRGNIVVWAGAIALAAVALVLAAPLVEDRPVLRVPLWGGAAAVIVVAALRLPQIRRGAGTFLGDTSYSTYLVQVFTIPVTYKAFALLALPIPGDAVLLVAVALTAAAGAATSLLFERPMTRALSRTMAGWRGAEA